MGQITGTDGALYFLHKEKVPDPNLRENLRLGLEVEFYVWDPPDRKPTNLPAAVQVRLPRT